MKELLVECLGFEWDDYNQYKNQKKHKVDWIECEEAFFDLFKVGFDESHSKNEFRYYCLGKTKTGRKLFIAFIIKNKYIRVISARDITSKEMRMYKE